jgi:SHS2 domain-containing protein
MKNKNNDNQKSIEKEFEFFDVTADIGYWAYGKSLNESFENAALAMFNVITNTQKIAKKHTREIYVESEDEVSLLYDFLEELLVLQELDLIFFSDFEVAIKKENTEAGEVYKLTAKATGENIDWDIHERKSEVKAITFHMMEVIYEDIYKVRVILDL